MRTSSRGFRPTEAEHIRQSEVCATCHTLYHEGAGTGREGDRRVAGADAVSGVAAQRVPGKKQSCQSCHMPVVKEEVPISKVLGRASRRSFAARVRGRQLLHAADAEPLSGRSQRRGAAAGVGGGGGEDGRASADADGARIAINRVDVRAGRLEAEVSVENLGGHKLPTAYPSRRAWLHVAVRDRNNRIVFESGAVDAKGQIAGNDNDADAPASSRTTTRSAAAIRCRSTSRSWWTRPAR